MLEIDVKQEYDQSRADRFYQDTFRRLKLIARVMLSRRLRESDATEDDLAQDGAMIGLEFLTATWAERGRPQHPEILNGLESEARAVAQTAMKRDFMDLIRRETRRANLGGLYAIHSPGRVPSPEESVCDQNEFLEVGKASDGNDDHRALFDAMVRLGDDTPDEISKEAGLERPKFYRWRSTMKRRFGRE